MKVLLVAIYIFFFQQDPFVGRVVRVIDGDTIEVLKDSVELIRIRFHGIDAPDKCQPYFLESKAFVEEKLLSNKIRFLQTDTDRYGRAVGEVYIDADNTMGEYPVWFNAALVGAGLAWHWPRYSNSQKLASMQIVAQKLKVGVWKESNPIPPWEFRKSEEYKKCNANY